MFVFILFGQAIDYMKLLALKEGIVRIVRTFGERLSAFKFPPRIAHKLQGFVDYN